jgi:site-specific recombinase XerD
MSGICHQLKAVSEMLGHSSVAITADIYQSVLTEQQQEIVKKMDDLYGDRMLDRV